jgi:glycosyltransferase involved in cell wall biosynthesis
MKPLTEKQSKKSIPNLLTNKVYHFIPGDGPNVLIQSIAMAPNLKIKILTLYCIDESVPKFCLNNRIEIESLGFTNKNLLRQSFRFLMYLYTEKPKLVFAHSFYPSLLCALGRIFYWKATFVPVRHHNKVHIISKNKKAILIDKLISRITAHTVGVSDAVRETLIEQGCRAKKISVIYNGLPKINSQYLSKRTEFINEPFNLIALGRIDWQKNYEGMLRIIAKLRQDGLLVKLVILGSGNQEYQMQLNKLQLNLGIEDCVIWLGKQSDIYEYLDRADLFIHTAIDEACPLVLIETMLYGIPVVSSNLGGCRDVLEGFYMGFNPHDVFGFSQAVLDTLENLDESKYYAKQIVNAVAKKFDPELMQSRYAELSVKLLS